MDKINTNKYKMLLITGNYQCFMRKRILGIWLSVTSDNTKLLLMCIDKFLLPEKAMIIWIN